MKETAIIFDLDETILPASSVPDSTFSQLFEAIRSANNGTVEKSLLEKALNEMKRISIDVVAEDYGFSDAMNDAAKEALLHADYNFKLKPFDDYPIIRDIPGLKILVTTGVIKLQQAKIDALHLKEDFNEIIIDNIYQEDRLGKKKIFSLVAERYKLKPHEIWIIGDNPDSEIAAGNELGMITVQRMIHGVKKADHATHFINSFYELKDLITSNK